MSANQNSSTPSAAEISATAKAEGGPFKGSESARLQSQAAKAGGNQANNAGTPGLQSQTVKAQVSSSVI